jgi:Arc-like DNA binding domain
MAKRKKTSTVQLKLRLREGLRQKLERQARTRNVSLNSEMVERLENSFQRGETDALLQLLAGSRSYAELLAILGRALQIAEKQLRGDAQRVKKTAAAISKIVEVQLGEANLSKAAFPNRGMENSADWLAYAALLGHHYRHLEEEFNDPDVH